MNNESKANADSSKFDKELENFEFFEDKKGETQKEVNQPDLVMAVEENLEANINNHQTESQQQFDEQKEAPEEKVEEEKETNDKGNPLKAENPNTPVSDFSNFEGTPLTTAHEDKKTDIFSFEEVKSEKKEDFVNEVDKMLSQINN